MAWGVRLKAMSRCACSVSGDVTDARNAPALGTSAPAPVPGHGCLILRLGGHQEGNLADKLDGKPLPAREAAKLVEALARAMQPAHSRNVVHRDLKPADFLGSKPFPVLTQSPSLAALRSVKQPLPPRPSAVARLRWFSTEDRGRR